MLQADSLVSYQTTPTYKHFGVEDGLPGTTVYCAEQDTDGFMWFGTDAGVSRFDGKEFVNYGVKDGVSDSDVLRIFEDSKGRIWFLTLKGILSYYFKGKIYNPGNDPDLPQEPAYNGLMTMHEDCYGTLWFGGIGSQVVVVSDLLGSKLLHLDEAKLNQGVSGWTFLYEPDSVSMWISAMEGKFVIDKKTLKYTKQPLNASIDSIALFCQSGPFEGLILSNRKVYTLKGSSFGNQIFSLALNTDYKDLKAEIDNNKNIWIYNHGQCMFYELNNGAYKDPVTFFPGQYVNRVFVDKEKNKWFCTSGNGVYLLSENQKWISNLVDPSGDKMVVLSIHRDHDGTIWFGTSDGILGRISNGKFSSFDLKADFGSSFRILSITSSVKNNIYCATDIGIVKISFMDGKYTQKLLTNDLVQNSAMKFVVNDRFGKIYCSDNSGICYLFESKGKEFRSSTLKNLPHKRTYSLFFDTQNRLWFENFDELICWDGLSLKSFAGMKRFFGNKITSINQLYDGTMLVATNGNGVRFLKNDSIIYSLNTSNGLCSDVCRRIFVDKDFVYVATNNGISRFEWSNNKVSGIETFNTNDGLSSDDINEIVTDETSIYLATSNGLCIVDKRISRGKADPPIVKITEIFHRNTKLTNFDNLHFKYHDANFTVRFIGLTFVNAEKVTYQFSNEGGNNWQESKTNSIQFSDLPSGQYDLLIRAKKYNSEWGEPSILSFEVSTPFYKSIWFYSITFFISIFCIYYIIQIISARKYERELQKLRALRELESERNRIASEMHDDLGADLTLIAIQARILRSQSDFSDSHIFQIDSIAASSSRLIDKMGEIIWALNTSNDTLINLISYIHKYVKDYLAANEINCNVVLPQQCPDVILNSAYRRNAYLIVKEAFHNIVKHSGAKHVTVSFEIDTAFKIIVSDDGCGFQQGRRRGNGIANMQHRAINNNAILVIENVDGTKVIYTDHKIKLKQ
jgi:signal transduction histidine kinase/streptogramin lyase